ncbi:MAG: hypothetical protein ACJA2W_003055 [Planctomycetota bacterium]|jgi:hypothetical protein
MRWIARPLDSLLGAAFLAVLAVPGVLAIQHGQQNAERTAAIIRRRPTPKPKAPDSAAAATGYSHGFDTWFNDAWGGRERALRANARLSMELFGTSPAQDLFFGRDGWVFSGESRAMESFTGTDPLTRPLLEAWKRSLQDRQRWLAARGIDHLVVLVPHKSTIYPEKLPEAIESARGVSRREHFIAWMREHSSVQFIDLAATIREAKPTEGSGDTSLRDLYSPHGVHWTPVGAHAAYGQIAAYLAEHHGSPGAGPIDEYQVEVTGRLGDSWASRMLLDGVIEMKDLELTPRTPTGVQKKRAPGGTAKDFQFRHPDATRPRIVMVHDSFGPSIRELLAEQASVLETRWRPWLERDVVERVKPDVVIELYSELSLVTRPPFRRSEYMGPGIDARFEKGEVLQRIDVSAPLRFEDSQAKRTVAVEAGAARITLLRGVSILRLPAPSKAAAQRMDPSSELILRLDLRTKVPGTIGIYRSKALNGIPSVGDLIPISVGPESAHVLIPLLPAADDASTWIFLQRPLEEVTLRGAEIRACDP